MGSTVNLALPLLAAAQAQKHVTHNEALLQLDAIVQLAVLDKDLNTPPPAPVDGQRYIVGPSPDGAWSGKAGWVAFGADGGWRMLAPSAGWMAFVADESALYRYSGAAWHRWLGTLVESLLFATDSANDIGALAASRPRDLFLGRNAAIGGTLTVAGNTTLGDSAGNTLTLTARLASGIAFATDNANDIGASGASRPRDLFLGRNASIAGTLAVTGAATLSGNLAVNGNTTLGDATTDTLTLTARLASGIAFATDNTNDIGASGANRPRDLFLGRNASIAGTLAVTGVITGTTRAVIDTLTVGRGGQTAVSSNTAFGLQALNSASLTGTDNLAMGPRAGRDITTGSGNVLAGTDCGALITTAQRNLIAGRTAGTGITTGADNVFLGANAGQNNNGSLNLIIGASAGIRLAGSFNTILGTGAGEALSRGVATLGAITGGSGYTDGVYNGVSLTRSSGQSFGVSPTANITVSGGAVTEVTIVTAGTGFQDTTTVLTASAASLGGAGAGFSVPVASLTGANCDNNVLIGRGAGASMTQGSNNIVIGTNVNPDSLTGSNQIDIGDRYFHNRFRLEEVSADPAAPAANNVVVFARDNGAGKTQLCVRFATGAIQVIATES